MSDNPDKPRVRVAAGSSAFTADSFQNFSANLGYGTNNLSSSSAYGFNPISRTHTQLEWMYRGSWIVQQVVNAPADDMTREGIEIESDMPPDDIDKLYQYLDQKRIWQRINSTIKWSRLYGGCLAVIMIKGQKPETPLRPETITKDQFQGLIVLDRWMVQPHLELPVDDPADPDYGYPSLYEVLPDTKTQGMRVHHSRCLRLDGVELPYWQKISENMWGLSILEPLFDRLIAFDSTTTGVAQLVYRANLRTLKIEKLREIIAFGGEAYQAMLEQVKLIRLMQTNEGLTILDASDDLQVDSYNFSGLSDVLIQFQQQLSGASQIPLTRLFGQSPAGMNATGESDIRNYYDSIAAKQESVLRPFMGLLLDVAYRSLTGNELPEGFNFKFAPLWQMNDEQRAKIAVDITNAVSKATEDMIITPAIALKELRQSSKVTGIYSNISDEDIQAAEEAPPPIMQQQEMAQEGATGGPGQNPSSPTRPSPKAAVAPSQAKEKDDGDLSDSLPPTTVEHVAKMYSMDSSQMADIVLGTDHQSSVAWVVLEQHPVTGHFTNFKYLVQFSDRDTALAAYKASEPNNQIRSVKRLHVNNLRDYSHVNGG